MFPIIITANPKTAPIPVQIKTALESFGDLEIVSEEMFRPPISYALGLEQKNRESPHQQRSMLPENRSLHLL